VDVNSGYRRGREILVLFIAEGVLRSDVITARVDGI
jgi:hypothetical protein